MKILALFAALAIAPASWADVKTYIGEGEYTKRDLTQGTYSVNTTVDHSQREKHVVVNTYTYMRDGQQVNMTSRYVIQSLNRNFFDVTDMDGNKMGDGYCMLASDQDGSQKRVCKYHFEQNDSRIEETAVFKGNKLHRMGSEKADDLYVIWSESLTLQ